MRVMHGFYPLHRAFVCVGHLGGAPKRHVARARRTLSTATLTPPRSPTLALIPIRRAGDPVLREIARKVRVPVDKSIHKLIEDMWETMYDAPGVGLAAPQIGVALKVIVIDVHTQEPIALVNPEIIKRSGERRVDEGCLSVPGFRGEITRSTKVLAQGVDPYTGKLVRVKAQDDLFAEALEHEIDHVNGILYIDYLSGPEALIPLSDAPEVKG